MFCSDTPSAFAKTDNPQDWADILTRLPLPFTAPQWWAWFDAWEHVDLVELITIGEHPAPELTAGPPCICPDGVPDIWCGIDHHAWLAMQRELGLVQPPPLPTNPCSCTYGLHPTLWCPTHLIDIPGVGQRGAAWTFRIDPFCPHHGEPPYDTDEPWYVGMLDEDERRGH